MSKDAVQCAVEIAGSQRALATRIGVFLGRPKFSQQTISYWIQNDTPIEAEYWPAFEFATDGLVTRERLRPDVFPASTRV